MEEGCEIINKVYLERLRKKDSLWEVMARAISTSVPSSQRHRFIDGKHAQRTKEKKRGVGENAPWT